MAKCNCGVCKNPDSGYDIEIMRAYSLLDRAWEFALLKHKGQKDDSGKDYFRAHIVGVFNILNAVQPDLKSEILAAGLLHDTLEDTDTSYEELKKLFGKKIADLVNEVTHEGTNDEYGYYFPRLKTRDAILIKLADRMSNISRMKGWGNKRKEQYLKRTKFWKDGSDKK